MSVLTNIFGGGKDDTLVTNVMTRQLLGSAIRWALTGTGFIMAGQATDNGNIEQIAGALITVATLLWSMYQKRNDRLEKLTGLQLAGVTEDHVKAMVANPSIPTPSVATPANVVPVPSTA